MARFLCPMTSGIGTATALPTRFSGKRRMEEAEGLLGDAVRAPLVLLEGGVMVMLRLADAPDPALLVPEDCSPLHGTTRRTKEPITGVIAANARNMLVGSQDAASVGAARRSIDGPHEVGTMHETSTEPIRSHRHGRSPHAYTAGLRKVEVVEALRQSEPRRPGTVAMTAFPSSPLASSMPKTEVIAWKALTTTIVAGAFTNAR